MMSVYTVIKFFLVVGWLLGMGWLIRFEAFPHLFEETARGYEALTRDVPALSDNWMRVMAGDKHVGYLHSSTQIDEANGREELALESDLVLRIRLGGTERILKLESEVRLNERSEFLHSRLWCSIGGMLEGEMSLRPEEGSDAFDLTLHIEFEELPEMRISRVIEIPQNVIVASPMLDNGLRSLRPGQTMRFRTLDPFSADGGIRTLVLRGEEVSEEERAQFDEDRGEVRKISMVLGDLTMNAWMDEYGRTLRQETPLGVTLVLSTPRESVQIPKGSALDFQDLLSNSPMSSFPQLPVAP